MLESTHVLRWRMLEETLDEEGAFLIIASLFLDMLSPFFIWEVRLQS